METKEDDPLQYAIWIIECYESEIRNAEQSIGVDLAKLGFCQGNIFTEARTVIARKKSLVRSQR